MKLLDKAKKVKTTARHGAFSYEEIELAIAWAKDEIGYKQVRTVLKFANSASTYCFLAAALREACRQGKL